MSNEAFITVLTGLAIAVGVIGTLVPIIPGLALSWLAMVVFGLVLGFGVEGWLAMAIATSLAVLGIYLGIRIPQRTAALGGLSIRGQLVGLALAVIGFFALPVIGAPVGFVGGVWIVRRRDTGDGRAAWVSTRETIRAMFRASAAQALCGLGMGLAWAVWAAVRLAG